MYTSFKLFKNSLFLVQRKYSSNLYNSGSYIKNRSSQHKKIFDFFRNQQTKNWDNIEPFKRDIYNVHPSTNNLKETEIEKIANQGILSCSEFIRPITKFEQLGVDNRLIEHLQTRFDAPTFIQMFSWPATLSGKNVIGLSITGSGKTLSYGVPMIEHIAVNKVNKSRRTRGLIICPTWELVKQVISELMKLSKLVGVYGSIFCGGESVQRQLLEFKGNSDYIVATPGRLLDVMDRGLIDLSNITYFVVDEADRMMEMGFENQLNCIFRSIRPDRQVTMWSATWPESVSRIAHTYIKSDATKMKIGGEKIAANKNITQEIILVNNAEKKSQLVKMLSEKEMRETRVLIFCNMTVSVDDLVRYLKNKLSMPILGLHGKMDRDRRKNVYEQFKNGYAKILIATDVASRGIDFSDINLVINYDFPQSI